MRKYWIMLALCLAACCGGAELKPFHGDNYILTAGAASPSR